MHKCAPLIGYICQAFKCNNTGVAINFIVTIENYKIKQSNFKNILVPSTENAYLKN